ncbi:hypothetical protein LguiB_006262 [Lonicera macranthoides]
MSNTHRFTGPPCAVCAYNHRRCPPSCEYAKICRNVIDCQDYHTIFTIFGVRNIASFLQDVPEDQYLEALNSYLLEATARVENPTKGCTTLLTSLEQKVEELQAWVTALEARLEGESSCVNPLCSFAPFGSFSTLLSSAENVAPDIVLTAANLPGHEVLSSEADLLAYPYSGGFLGLLTSVEDGAPDIPQTTVNLPENGALLDLPTYPTLSNYQAVLADFSLQPPQVGSIAKVVELSSPDWTALVDLRKKFDHPSFDLNYLLNFSADELWILRPFLSD